VVLADPVVELPDPVVELPVVEAALVDPVEPAVPDVVAAPPLPPVVVLLVVALSSEHAALMAAQAQSNETSVRWRKFEWFMVVPDRAREPHALAHEFDFRDSNYVLRKRGAKQIVVNDRC
jgi:hypothetical protein